MTRYCTVDRNEITDAKRLARNSPYCSDDCQKKAKAERRERRGACRMCGRGMTKLTTEIRLRRKLAAAAEAFLGAWPQHSFEWMAAAAALTCALEESASLDVRIAERLRTPSTASEVSQQACAPGAQQIQEQP